MEPIIGYDVAIDNLESSLTPIIKALEKNSARYCINHSDAFVSRDQAIRLTHKLCGRDQYSAPLEEGMDEIGMGLSEGSEIAIRSGIKKIQETVKDMKTPSAQGSLYQLAKLANQNP